MCDRVSVCTACECQPYVSISAKKSAHAFMLCGAHSTVEGMVSIT